MAHECKRNEFAATLEDNVIVVSGSEYLLNVGPDQFSLDYCPFCGERI